MVESNSLMAECYASEIERVLVVGNADGIEPVATRDTFVFGGVLREWVVGRGLCCVVVESEWADHGLEDCLDPLWIHRTGPSPRKPFREKIKSCAAMVRLGRLATCN